MLSEQERAEIDAELEQYPDRQSVHIEALKIVQQHRGWVSDEALADVAAYLGAGADELDGVATFYNLLYRRPVGRHVILLCDSVSCWIMGYERICAALAERLGIALGETTADGRFTLLPVPCLGTCDGSPAMMVGEDLHTHLDPESLEQVLERYP